MRHPTARLATSFTAVVGLFIFSEFAHAQRYDGDHEGFGLARGETSSASLPVEQGKRSDSSSDTSSNQPAKLEEIVVTAQRRSESIQNVPIAITALTGEQLTGAGINSTQSLTSMVPSLQIGIASGNGNVFLRGVGTTNNTAGNESSVAVYIDDVYFAQASSVVTSLENVERIEVLKGPQGTLYGRNATGGLIHIITPDPTADASAKAQVGYESFNTITGSLYATGGLTDRLKGNISADVHEQRNGFGTNLTTGDDANSVHYTHVKGKLLWEPTTADSITLAATYFKDTSTPGIDSVLPPFSTSVLGQTYPGNPWDTQGPDAHISRQMIDSSLRWIHTFDNGMVFKSVSAYTNLRYRLSGYNVDGDAPAVATAAVATDSHTVQQEFLLQSAAKLLERQLTYSAGLFYFYFPYPKFGLNLSLPSAGIALAQNSTTATHSYAAFGQADYDITDRDTLTAGLRYTIDELSATELDITTIPGLGALTQADAGDARFGEMTWRLALKHAFTDNFMVYGSYSRGYKSGLFNTSVPTQPGAPLGRVDPEILDSYNIGSKGTFLNRALQLSLEGFYYNYKNLQVQNIVNGTSVLITNASTARIYGVDAEAVAAVPVPVGNLQLRASGGYLHSRYTSFPDCIVNTLNAFPPGGTTASIGNCADNQLAFAPTFTGTLGGSYMVPIGPLGGKLGPSFTYYHSAGFFYAPDNLTKQHAYNTLAADISYVFAHDQARLRVYGTNLTNAQVFEYCFAASYSDTCYAAPPRIVGAAFEYRWH